MTKTIFEVGDVVKCVREGGFTNHLKLDGIYTISYVYNTTSGDTQFVNLSGDEGFVFGASRFKHLSLWERIALDRTKAKEEATLTWEGLQEFEPQPWRNDKPQMHFPDGDTEADPRDKEPFDVGDRVTCVDDSAAIGLCCGDEYVVSLVRAHSMHGRWLVELEDTDSRYYASRFELVETPTPAFKKGDIVECVDDEQNTTVRKGQLYKVESVTSDEHVVYIRIGGIVRAYGEDRFKLYDVKENSGIYPVGGASEIVLNEARAAAMRALERGEEPDAEDLDIIQAANERPYDAGDIIKCVDNTTLITKYVKVGYYYRVISIVHTKHGWMTSVDLGNGDGSMEYFAYRFEALHGEERDRLSSLFEKEYPI